MLSHSFIHIPHDWALSPAAAIQLQKELAQKVISQDLLGKVRYVAGVDVGFPKNKNIARAATVVLSYPGLEPLDSAVIEESVRFPYIPGLLSFRELPALLKALEKLRILPDLILCDGQGIAHPRRLGIAAHLGVITDIPCIGVAKSRLTGIHEAVPEEKGQWAELKDAEETIGAVLRTRKGVKPLFVSIGHKISLITAVEYVLGCVTRYRLPETTRQAHRLASGIK